MSKLTQKNLKKKLLKEGTLFWQDCKILKENHLSDYEIETVLKCPYCMKGKIIRYKDNTPGYKESRFEACDICGLSGDGATLELKTIKKKK